jgi:hypothetical protein
MAPESRQAVALRRLGSESLELIGRYEGVGSERCGMKTRLSYQKVLGRDLVFRFRWIRTTHRRVAEHEQVIPSAKAGILNRRLRRSRGSKRSNSFHCPSSPISRHAEMGLLHDRRTPGAHADSIAGIDRTNSMDQRQATKYVQRPFEACSLPARSRGADCFAGFCRTNLTLNLCVNPLRGVLLYRHMLLINFV